MVTAMASFFVPILGENIGVGKIPIPYKIAISQKCEIVVWIDDVCSFHY